jgi:hypothetical protein
MAIRAADDVAVVILLRFRRTPERCGHARLFRVGGLLFGPVFVLIVASASAGENQRQDDRCRDREKCAADPEHRLERAGVDGP